MTARHLPFKNGRQSRDEYSVENLKLIRQHHKNCKTHLKGKKFIYLFYNNKIVNMDQFLVICALTQFLVGIEKLSHKYIVDSLLAT